MYNIRIIKSLAFSVLICAGFSSTSFGQDNAQIDKAEVSADNVAEKQLSSKAAKAGETKLIHGNITKKQKNKNGKKNIIYKLKSSSGESYRLKGTPAEFEKYVDKAVDVEAIVELKEIKKGKNKGEKKLKVVEIIKIDIAQ